VYSQNKWLSIRSQENNYTYSHSNQHKPHDSITSCSSMGYSQTSDLVTICPDRYLLTNIKQGAVSLQLTCISGNRVLVVNCQNSTFLRYLVKSEVLQLTGIYYLCRTVPASIQNVTHFFWYVYTWANSTELRDPKYLTQCLGEVIAVPPSNRFQTK